IVFLATLADGDQHFANGLIQPTQQSRVAALLWILDIGELCGVRLVRLQRVMNRVERKEQKVRLVVRLSLDVLSGFVTKGQREVLGRLDLFTVVEDGGTGISTSRRGDVRMSASEKAIPFVEPTRRWMKSFVAS